MVQRHTLTHAMGWKLDVPETRIDVSRMSLHVPETHAHARTRRHTEIDTRKGKQRGKYEELRTGVVQALEPSAAEAVRAMSSGYVRLMMREPALLAAVLPCPPAPWCPLPPSPRSSVLKRTRARARARARRHWKEGGRGNERALARAVRAPRAPRVGRCFGQSAVSAEVVVTRA